MLTVLRHFAGFLCASLAGALAAQLALTGLVAAAGVSEPAFTEAGLLRFVAGVVYMLAWIVAGALVLGVPMVIGLRMAGHHSLRAFAVAGAIVAAAAALALRAVFGADGWDASALAILVGAFALAGLIAAAVFRGIAGPRSATARAAERVRPATASCPG